MELLQLRYFCDAAETENFSRTANKFYVPTSNISQTIKRLERELGKPLFTRSANRIHLNEAGRAFYKDIHTALDLIDTASVLCKQSCEIVKMDIVVGRRVAMEVIENFGKENPGISFVTSHAAVDTPDGFDVIVTDQDLDIPYLKIEVAEENLLLAYNGTIFSLDAGTPLEELPFITMHNGSSLYENTLRVCAALGFSPRIVLQGEDPFFVRKCIELGLGVCIVPELSWQDMFSEEIALKKLGDFKRSIWIYRRHMASPMLERFHNTLIQAYAECSRQSLV